MIATAPRSSAMATVVRNSFSEVGARLPRSASTPIAKAMSVAAGIAQPRLSPAAAGGQSEIEQRRHRHPGRRGDDRQPPPLPGRQPPVDELALDLQPDQQEEQGHQAVVDPQMDGHRPQLGRRAGPVSGVGEADRPRPTASWPRSGPAPPRAISSSPPAASLRRNDRRAERGRRPVSMTMARL